MKVRVGTSGFSYKPWKGTFYPEKLPDKEMLSYYATQLNSVEINNTFYRLPKADVLKSWAADVPDGFKFAIKASRRITHMKRLKEVDDATEYLLRTTSESLGDRLGVIFFQLPPNMKKDAQRLEAFLNLLPAGTKAAFEFRHASWFDDDVYELLRQHQSALCLAETDDQQLELVHTADWGYVRLRRQKYSAADLVQWAQRLRAFDWNESYVFFNHEDAGVGPELAKQLRELLD